MLRENNPLSFFGDIFFLLCTRKKWNPVNLKQYQDYFENEFKIEYENMYFEFRVTQNVNEDEFNIQITKL